MSQTLTKMKKLPVIAALSLFAALTFSSCKKDYSCTCQVGLNPLLGQLGGTEFSFDTTFVYEFEDMKKKEAKAGCDGVEKGLFETFPGIITGSCSLEKQ